MFIFETCLAREYSLPWDINCISYTLSREYRVVRYRYSLLVFASEGRLCANLRVQEQSTNMTSQCQSYIRVTSQINCGDVTILNQKRVSLATMAKSAIDNCFSRIVCSGHQIACKKLNNTPVTVNNDFGVTREAICQWFSLVTSTLVKIIGKSLHSWPKNRYTR